MAGKAAGLQAAMRKRRSQYTSGSAETVALLCDQTGSRRYPCPGLRLRKPVFWLSADVIVPVATALLVRSYLSFESFAKSIAATNLVSSSRETPMPSIETT